MSRLVRGRVIVGRSVSFSPSATPGSAGAIRLSSSSSSAGGSTAGNTTSSAGSSTPASSSSPGAPPPPSPSSSSSSSSSKRQSYWDVGLLAAAGAGISGLLLWRSSKNKRSRSEQLQDDMTKDDSRSFTVPVLSQTGGQSTKTLTLLSQHETNARLKENEVSYTVSRKANPVWRYDTNAVASNSPIEDDNCCVILERDPQSHVKGDLMFFGVFDGHSGWHTSRLLSSSLVAYVARELDLVYRGAPHYAQLAQGQQAKTSPSFWSLFQGGGPTDKPLELDLKEPIVQAAIRNGFEKMDKDIVEAPIRRLNELEQKGAKPIVKPGSQSEMTPEQTEALQTLLPALSGSCALLAFLDAGRNKLHVACTGDSRAVMGTWEPDPSGKGGKWRADVLTEDQTGRNEKEVKRMQKEHPAEEAETVIMRGRVLGSLEPTRAFGDARYKWPLGMQARLADAFHPGPVRNPPRNYATPPYVTATPEVTTVDLSSPVSSSTRKSLASFLPVSSSSDSTPQTTRFIVLATDGLYDRLGNDEIVSLVGAHLSGVRGSQTRKAVLSHLAPSSFSSVRSQSHLPRQEPVRGEGDAYTFEDGNLSTHLIRNALGGAKREQVSVLLSIPAPISRRYRDDITVHVVLLQDPATSANGIHGGVGGVGGNGNDGQQAFGGVVKRVVDNNDLPPVKSKL